MLWACIIARRNTANGQSFRANNWYKVNINAKRWKQPMAWHKERPHKLCSLVLTVHFQYLLLYLIVLISLPSYPVSCFSSPTCQRPSRNYLLHKMSYNLEKYEMLLTWSKSLTSDDLEILEIVNSSKRVCYVVRLQNFPPHCLESCLPVQFKMYANFMIKQILNRYNMTG